MTALNDAPLWSAEITGDPYTLRATVDETSDGKLYCCVTMETLRGDLRQMTIELDRHGWLRLADLAERAVRVIDRHEREAAA